MVGEKRSVHHVICLPRVVLLAPALTFRARPVAFCHWHWVAPLNIVFCHLSSQHISISTWSDTSHVQCCTHISLSDSGAKRNTSLLSDLQAPMSLTAGHV